MPDDHRLRTRELLELLELTVPTSAIRISDLAVVVAFRIPLVAFMRRAEGWVAVVVTRGEPVEEHPFVGFDAARALIDELWPLDDEATDAILDDSPDGEHAQAVDTAVAALQRLLAARGYPELVFRPHKQGELAERIHAQVRAQVREFLGNGDDEQGGGGHEVH